LIAVLKLLKAALLIAVGIGAVRFLHRDLAAAATHWVEILRVDPDNRFVHRFLSAIFRITPKELKALSVGTFLYAGLFLTEGVGLLMEKRWAEWFTIITTSLLLPIEAYELAAHFTITRLVVLIVNGLIVAYLIARVRR
jgi:uncharacterized membrane protein (DUF2068 family)